MDTGSKSQIQDANQQVIWGIQRSITLPNVTLKRTVGYPDEQDQENGEVTPISFKRLRLDNDQKEDNDMSE